MMMTPERIRHLRKVVRLRPLLKISNRDLDDYLTECLDEIERLQRIVAEIPELVVIVARDQRANPGGYPSIYQRGDVWRYHVVAGGNGWEDGSTPLEAAKGVDREP